MRKAMLSLSVLLFSIGLHAIEIVEIFPLTEKILVVHFDEGKVIHHQLGQKKEIESVQIDPLNITKATELSAYFLSSTDDSNFQNGLSPKVIYRKSKGTDFAWLCQGWNGRCVNEDPDHTKEHWIYLVFDEALSNGKNYQLAFQNWSTALDNFSFEYDDRKLRSEAVHVNQIGYVPSAGEKYGYVYHWLGDGGGMNFTEVKNNKFFLINQSNQSVAFEGQLIFRKGKENKETGQTHQTPDGNFLGSEVYECDFSSFEGEGTFQLCVEGVGCSFEFEINDEVYEEPWSAVMNGIYQQRSGIALEADYTDQVRPAPHNPMLTAGFAGKLVYSDFRYPDLSENDGSMDDKAGIDAKIKGPINVAGWYQDAGDWDGYFSHFEVPTLLLWLYEMAPKKFGDGQLILPERNNGYPDLLDEALWLPQFYYRLRQEMKAKGYGTGGVGGGRIFADLWGEKTDADENTRGSWQDVDRQWGVLGEDPFTSFKYAAVAAKIAFINQSNQLTDPSNIDWTAEAISAYDWALNNTLPNDVDLFGKRPIYTLRMHAAAALYRLTGEEKYHNKFQEDLDGLADDEEVIQELAHALSTYVKTKNERSVNDNKYQDALTRMKANAQFVLEDYRDERACRWGGNYWFPMLVGQGTTPLITNGILGHFLIKDQEPNTARQLERSIYSTADYFLGNNPLNMCWITGVGDRSPTEILCLDSWYLGGDTPRKGIVPYGPWISDANLGELGPWNHNWANQTLHPENIEDWPGHERWFEQRYAPFNGEYTIHQNLVTSALNYGLLFALTANDVSTSTKDVGESPSQFKVYPNPSRGAFQIETELHEAYELEVINLQGRILRKHNNSKGASVNVNGLPAGTYFIKLMAASGYEEIQKIIVQ